MFIHNRLIHRRVRHTNSESPEGWLERLRRLKHDPRLLKQIGPMPHSKWQTNAESPELEQARLALLKRDPQLLPRFGAFYRHLAALPRRARRWLERKAVMTLTTAALLLALSDTPVAHAAGLSVTTTDPNIAADGQCSLIEAIDNANADAQTHADCLAGSGADIISLLANSTFTLTGVNNTDNGLPQITSAITIEGNGATIARQSGAPTFRIFDVLSSGNLSLNNTTVSGGGGPGSEALGGGIKNFFGTVTLTNSTVSGNSSNAQGGGIFNQGTVTLNNSTVSGNSGGGGGGITNSGALTLNNSTVSGNSAGGGGGILSRGGTSTLNNSTVSGNTANVGGGIYNYGVAMALNDSTVSSNTASSEGGGIYNYGAGFYPSTVTLVRSLISGNNAPVAPEVSHRDGYYSGGVNGNNFNLIGHDGNAGSVGFTPSGSDIVPTQPLAAILAPLANNGGATQTHALVPGSPAVDAAPAGPAADQRGVARPQGSAFDIGAFELEQAPSDTTPPIITPNVAGTLGNNDWYRSDVTVSWTVSDPESPITSQTGCDPVTINADTSGTALTCSATSAGGTSTQSVTVKRDATAPTASASAAPAPNAAGWNNTDVTVSFNGSDATSGIAACSAPVILSAEGAGQSASGSCTDNAGNASAPATASGIKIDKTAPATAAGVAVSGNFRVLTLAGSDALSGLAATAYSVNGGAPQAYVGPVAFNAAGSYAVSFFSTDQAGNAEAGQTTTVVVPMVNNAAVSPVLECVVNNGNGTYTARFGYNNTNTIVIFIPVGGNNKFTPAPQNRGQTTAFQPGRNRNTFLVTFITGNQVWSLKGPDNRNRTSTAGPNSAPCAP